MIIFFACAALLVVICLLWLVAGLFRDKQSSTDQETVNVTLARERRSTLEAALADGAIDQATYDYEREQLEYDLAADLKLDEERHAAKRGGHVGAAILVTVFVPIAAGVIYLQLGNPGAITQDRTSPQTAANTPQGIDTAEGGQAPALATLLPQLEERLEANPDDIQGWRLLGRSYLSVSEFEKAAQAFSRALTLDENDTATLAQLAESIAMTRNGNLAGEPMQLLERSIAINPGHEHSLWLMSIGRQQAGDHDAALQGFNRLASIAKDNPEALATIEQMRSTSVQALGQQSVSKANQETEETGNEAVTAIDVTVTLADNAQANADPAHSVFIYAKATKGPPMPLAVSRHSVSDLPLTVTLDSTMAMIPTMTLDSFDNITVGARVSASGNPVAQSGDWFHEVSDIDLSDRRSVELTISQQEP